MKKQTHNFIVTPQSDYSQMAGEVRKLADGTDGASVVNEWKLLGLMMVNGDDDFAAEVAKLPSVKGIRREGTVKAAAPSKKFRP